MREFALNAVIGARLPEAVAEGERGDLTEALSQEPLADRVGEPFNGSVVAGLRDHGVYVSSNYQGLTAVADGEAAVAAESAGDVAAGEVNPAFYEALGVGSGELAGRLEG